jgi:hypothetical protein
VEGGGVLRTEIFDSPAERGPSDHVLLMVEVGLSSVDYSLSKSGSIP